MWNVRIKLIWEPVKCTVSSFCFFLTCASLMWSLTILEEAFCGAIFLRFVRARLHKHDLIIAFGLGRQHKYIRTKSCTQKYLVSGLDFCNYLANPVSGFLYFSIICAWYPISFIRTPISFIRTQQLFHYNYVIARSVCSDVILILYNVFVIPMVNDQMDWHWNLAPDKVNDTKH